LVSEQGSFKHSLKHWKADPEEMGGHMALSAIEAPLFNGTDYFSWRENMKQFLKSKGSEVWNSVVSKPWDLTTSKNLSKITIQRRARKNNEVALKILLNGLSDTVKTRIGLCTSAKDLWMKLENMYQIKNKDTEDIPIKDEDEDSTINKSKDSPQYFDCNSSDIKSSSASKEEDSDTITKCSVSIYPMEEEEEELSKAKEKVDWSFHEYLYHHNESDYSYLHDYTQEFLEKNKKHVLKIKEMLKDCDKIIYEQDNQLEEKEEEIEKLKKEINQVKEKEKENDELGNQKHILEIKEKLKYNKEIISEQKIQLENKEDEIKRLKTKVVGLTEENEEKINRLKNEISQAKEEKKEDDVSSKNIVDLKELRENYVNLKIQLEEAKRREEVVRNQLDKKEESCHEMEAEVVNLRKKVQKSDTQNKFLISSMTLDEILDSQRSPSDKSGLGYNKEKISIPKKSDAGPSFVKGENMSDTVPSVVKDEDRSETTSSFAKSKSRYDSVSTHSRNKSNTTKFRRSDHGRHPEAIHSPQSKFRRETPSWMNQRRYESVFKGYCFACNEYGHKALDCRHHGRKQIGRFNNNIRCWNCNHVGHIAAHCYTMRCYSCGEYGHKAYNCWNSRKQLIRNASHNMTTRVNKKIWKIKSQVPNKKDEENIAPEIDEVNNRSLGDKTSNKEYSQNKDKESSGAHNDDVDDESSILEQQKEVTDKPIVHKILRSLPMRYDAKISSIKDRSDLNTLTVDQLHGIFTAYEMRTGHDKSTKDEIAFKASDTKINQEKKPQSNHHEESDVEEANFIRKLQKGSGKYKGKPLYKCFNCGKVGHFASKCPYPNEDPEDEANYLMDIPSISIDIGGKL
jgi:hypothetical protein